MPRILVRISFLIAVVVGAIGFKGLQIRLESLSTGQSHLFAGGGSGGAPSGRGGRTSRISAHNRDEA